MRLIGMVHAAPRPASPRWDGSMQRGLPGSGTITTRVSTEPGAPAPLRKSS